jgi:peptidoglycan/LPS O-acetylase OafA/YrhL
MTTDKAANQAPRMHYIDGLRAIAMLSVLLFHSYLYAGLNHLILPLGSNSIDLAWPLQFGHYGVNLFLLLSGFCLYWPFVKKGQRAEPTLAEYAYRRCRRILPPYYMVLVIFGGLGFVQVLTHFQIYHRSVDMQFVLGWLAWHVFMIHNLSPENVLALDAPLWSLALEFQLYVLFPLFVEAYRRWNKRAVLLVVLALCSLYRAGIPSVAVTDDAVDHFVLASSVFGRCFEFALGMYVADFLSKWPQQGKSPISIWDCIFGAAVILAGIWRFDIFEDAAVGVVDAALVLAASRVAGPVWHFLSHRYFVRTGIFSYSVYLIHQPIIQAVGPRLMQYHLNTLVHWALVLGILLPSLIGLGYVYHLLFEKRFMSAPRKRASTVAQVAKIPVEVSTT